MYSEIPMILSAFSNVKQWLHEEESSLSETIIFLENKSVVCLRESKIKHIWSVHDEIGLPDFHTLSALFFGALL